MMTFGRLSPTQQHVLRPFVRDRVVYDLGAGSGELSVKLLKLGASRVVAVDKCKPTVKHERVKWKRGGFHTVAADIDVAFVSWPINANVAGLASLVSISRTVVYLGKNTDGTQCGTPHFFRWLIKRRLVAYVPEVQNTLIVCDEYLNSPRRPTGEERAGIDADTTTYTFHEAEEGLPGRPYSPPVYPF